VLFLDTRNSRDWAEAKVMIPAAIRIDSSETLTRVARETPKDKLIVTYCT
jgi:rhodanese-related sulfurtransferase